MAMLDPQRPILNLTTREEQVSAFISFLAAAELPGDRGEWEARCQCAVDASEIGGALFYIFVDFDPPELQEARSFVARSKILAALFDNTYC